MQLYLSPDPPFLRIQVPVDEVYRLSSYFQASKAHLVETCDSWKQAHSFSYRMIADLKAQLAALDIPIGDVGQTSEQGAGDRTESLPAEDEAEDEEDGNDDDEDDE